MPRGQKSALTFPPIGHRSSAAGDCAPCVGELLPDSAVSRNHFVKSFTLKMSSCPGICSAHSDRRRRIHTRTGLQDRDLISTSFSQALPNNSPVFFDALKFLENI